MATDRPQWTSGCRADRSRDTKNEGLTPSAVSLLTPLYVPCILIRSVAS